jgi:glycosyltransferase involved in cell wall biosynthesis
LVDFFRSTNIFILPSVNEGVPVSLVEGMKAGLVPVIANWTSNVNQLVIDGESGFVLQDTSVSSYVSALASIYASHNQSHQISVNASKIANDQFDPFRQVDEFETYLLEVNESRTRIKKKVYGSRLDDEKIPNIITIFLRKLKSLWAPH